MSTLEELKAIADAIHSIEGRFVSSRSLGLHLSSENEAEFARLVVEAKALLDTELGKDNDFSKNLVHAVNSNSGGFLGGVWLSGVQTARAMVEGGMKQVSRRHSHVATPSMPGAGFYVSASRLAELRGLKSSEWDLTRLIRLSEELNLAHSNHCYMSVAMLVRAIADHVPPIFACKSFSEVANNYAGAKSFKASMANLNNSLRNIADAHLHLHIRSSEVLPTESQVEFRADIDALLAEVVRLLK